MSQVINSILFLIFVEHPYFNEPGYQSSQGTAQGDRQSEAYNQVQCLSFVALFCCGNDRVAAFLCNFHVLVG